VYAQGLERWNDGRLREYIKTTAFDPAIGYPIGDDVTDESSELSGEIGLDGLENPIILDEDDEEFMKVDDSDIDG